MRSMILLVCCLLWGTQIHSQTLSFGGDPIAEITPTLEILDRRSSTLQNNRGVLEEKIEVLRPLASSIARDLEMLEEFEPIIPDLDKAQLQQFLNTDITTPTQFREFQSALSSVISFRNFLTEESVNAFRNIERSRPNLLNEIVDDLGIEFSSDQEDSVIRSFQGACEFVLRGRDILPDALTQCKTDVRALLGARKPQIDISVLARTNASVQAVINELQAQLNSDATEIEQIKAQRENIIRQAQVNSREAIPIEMVATICATLIVFASIMWFVTNAIIKLATANTQDEYENKAKSFPIFLELVTVFILTVTILILGLANKINNEALAALIGGISGYVLGRIKQGGTAERPSDAVAQKVAPQASPPEGSS